MYSMMYQCANWLEKEKDTFYDDNVEFYTNLIEYFWQPERCKISMLERYFFTSLKEFFNKSIKIKDKEVILELKENLNKFIDSHMG